MTVRPDPSFHASPKLAMEAPPENFAYTLLLSKPACGGLLCLRFGSRRAG